MLAVSMLNYYIYLLIWWFIIVQSICQYGYMGKKMRSRLVSATVCGLCLFSPFLCDPLGPFPASFSGLMLPKLYDAFGFKVVHSHFVALYSVQWLFLKSVLVF